MLPSGAITLNRRVKPSLLGMPGREQAFERVDAVGVSVVERLVDAMAHLRRAAAVIDGHAVSGRPR
jgi:hypothetical protein